MRALIIGGTSSVGKALKPVLSEFSEVITAGRKNCDIIFDLKDPVEKFSFPDNIDVIIHTAAQFAGTTDAEILETENINVLGTLKVCQAAFKAKVKHFVLISSIFTELSENSDFFSVYSLSKRQSEEIAKFYCTRHHLPLTILKPSQIYGNENSFRVHQPFLYTIADKAEKGESIELYGSNDALRNFIHIDDLTKIIAKIIQGKIEGVYSCMYPADLTYSQLAKAALKAFNSKGTVHFLKDKKDIPDNIFTKDDRLYKITGFYPQISIEEGMKKLADYRKRKA